MSKRPVKLGSQFGRLKVIEHKGFSTYGYATWLCICNCGNQVVVPTTLLTGNVTKSCGCLRKESSKERLKQIQGKVKVIYRGLEVNREEAIRQGNLPIYLVKERLKQGWSFDDAMDTPRGVDEFRRKGKYLVKGEVMTLTEAVKRFGKVSRQDVYLRLAKGWNLEEALFTPRANK